MMGLTSRSSVESFLTKFRKCWTEEAVARLDVINTASHFRAYWFVGIVAVLLLVKCRSRHTHITIAVETAANARGNTPVKS
jgi:hypothetical protein